MLFIFLRILASILYVISGFIKKTVNISTDLQCAIGAIIPLLIMPIILYVIYKKNPSLFKIKDKTFKHLSDNPFKNIFSIESLYLTIPSLCSYISYIILLRALPISVISTISPMYIIFSIIFNKLLIHTKITANKIISIIIVLFGIIFANFKNISKDIKKIKSKFIIPLMLIWLILTGFQISYSKYLLNGIDFVEVVAMDYILGGIMFLFGFIIYNLFIKKQKYTYDVRTIGLLVVLSIMGIFATLSRYDALQHIPAYISILIGNIKLPLTLLISFFWLKENVNIYKVIGAICIIFGISYSDIEPRVMDIFRDI